MPCENLGKPIIRKSYAERNEEEERGCRSEAESFFKPDTNKRGAETRKTGQHLLGAQKKVLRKSKLPIKFIPEQDTTNTVRVKGQ